MARTRLHCSPLEARDIPTVGLVADLNPGGFSAPALPAQNGTAADVSRPTLNGVAYFTADDGTHGRELWRSDGTPAGTRMVADLSPGAASTAFAKIVVANGRIIFSADMFDDGVQGHRLYSSDGTTGGTGLLVTNLTFAIPGTADKQSQAAELTAFGSGVVWSGLTDDGTGGVRPTVWLTDVGGAGHGASFNLEPNDTPLNAKQFAVVGSHIVFQAQSPMGQSGLWASDGTPANTAFLAPDDNLYGFQSLTALGGRAVALLPKDADATDYELWSTDGTKANTQTLGVSGTATLLGGLVAAGGRAFFSARSTEDGTDRLYATEGLPGTTKLLAAGLNPAANDEPLKLPRTDGVRLYFPADDGTHGVEMWVSDGTDGGTKMLADIAPGAADAVSLYTVTAAPIIPQVNGVAYFLAANHLVRTDGTAAGTFSVEPGATNANRAGVTDFYVGRVGAEVLFQGGPDTAPELWKAESAATPVPVPVPPATVTAPLAAGPDFQVRPFQNSPYRLLSGDGPPQIVWLDFDGQNLVSQVHPGISYTLPAFRASEFGFDDSPEVRTGVIGRILSRLGELFDGVNIQFTTTRPADGESMRVSIGDPAAVTARLNDLGLLDKYIGKGAVSRPDGGYYVPLTQVLNSATLLGRAQNVDIHNRDRNDEAFVLSKPVADWAKSEGLILDATVPFFANIIAHEVGHNLGLLHLKSEFSDAASGLTLPDTINLMRPIASSGSGQRFVDRMQDVHAPSALSYGVYSQNSLQEVRYNLGGLAALSPGSGSARSFGVDVTGLDAGVRRWVVGLYTAADSALSTDGEADDTAGFLRFIDVPVGGRVTFTVPPGYSNPRISLLGSTRDDGTFDVFSGVAAGGRLTGDGTTVPLSDADGTIPLWSGEPGALQSAGAARLTVADGFVAQSSVAAPRTAFAIGADAGAEPFVRLIDARNNREYFSLLAYDAAFTGGVRVAAADVNGDGIPDVIAGAGPGGGPRIRVFDGATGAPLAGPLDDFFAYEDGFRGGVTVAAGDVDGDGYQDVVVGSGLGGGPRIRVFSGKDGRVIRDFFAYEDSFRGGVNVHAADFDGDGKADIAAGSGVGGGPRVRVLSGADLSELKNYFAYEDSFRGGVTVAFGDVDGDGVQDVVAGSGVGGGPVVRAFSGKTGAVVSEQFVFDADLRAGVRVSTVRTDGTSLKASIVAAPGPGGPPRVKVYDALSGESSADASAFDAAFTGGVFVG